LGFGTSDELSSDEEEVIQSQHHHEMHPATLQPTSASASSVRKRNIKSSPKPASRPQVNLFASLYVFEAVKLDLSSDS